MDHATSIQRLGAAPDDREAWAAVVADHGGLCWRIALRMLGDEQTAADAVQDCLLALRAGAPRFRPGPDPLGAATAWVARVAVNSCHRYRRRRPTYALAGDLAAGEPPADHAEHLPELRAAISELPANQREAVSLRYLAGLDYPALAAALGIGVNAARVRVHRALSALRGLLERRGVALSAVALGGWLDDLAASPPPPPPATAVTAWTSAALPSLPLLGTGTIAAMIFIPVLLAASLAVVWAPSSPPAPETAPPLAPAPLVAGSDEMHDRLHTRLAWLAGRQRPDGAWPGAGGGADPAITALAVCAFQDAGYYSGDPHRYRPVLDAGQAWLRAHRPAPTAPVAEQALVLGAILQHTINLRRDIAALHAREVVQLLTLRNGMGWPARPGESGIDARATACAVMALAHAQSSDVPLAGGGLEQAWRWAVAARGDGGRPFPARTDGQGRPEGGAGDDAAGLIVAALADPRRFAADPGWRPGLARVRAGGCSRLDRWFLASAAFSRGLGGERWQEESRDLPQVLAEGDRLVAAGDLEGVLAATLTWEVHERAAIIARANAQAAAFARPAVADPEPSVPAAGQ